MDVAYLLLECGENCLELDQQVGSTLYRGAIWPISSAPAYLVGQTVVSPGQRHQGRMGVHFHQAIGCSRGRGAGHQGIPHSSEILGELIADDPGPFGARRVDRGTLTSESPRDGS